MVEERVKRRLRRMPGLIEETQGERLAALAAGVHEWASIVEIGSHTGLSTCWMGHASTGAHVFAVDPWGDPRPGSRDDPFGFGSGDATFQRFCDNLTAEHLWDRVTPIRARSTDIARFWVQPIGLLFVDAVHTEEAVQEDVEAWAERIYRGGWLALHDYDDNPDHEYYGVSVAADRLAASGDWRVEPLVGSLWTAQRV